MTTSQIALELNLRLRTDVESESEVSAGYASDLLSDVLANAKRGTLWVTNQKHQNIVGVAVMLDLAGVVVAGGIEPDENTLEKARDEKVPLYTSGESVFDVVGGLYEMGLRSA